MDRLELGPAAQEETAAYAQAVGGELALDTRLLKGKGLIDYQFTGVDTRRKNRGIKPDFVLEVTLRKIKFFHEFRAANAETMLCKGAAEGFVKQDCPDEFGRQHAILGPVLRLRHIATAALAGPTSREIGDLAQADALVPSPGLLCGPWPGRVRGKRGRANRLGRKGRAPVLGRLGERGIRETPGRDRAKSQEPRSRSHSKTLGTSTKSRAYTLKSGKSLSRIQPRRREAAL